MEPTTTPPSSKRRDRVSKRTSNACVRCRRQKIKCSGTQPCDGCSKRRMSCEFDAREQRIVVTRGFILDLQQTIQEQESGGPQRLRRSARHRGSPDPAPDNPQEAEFLETDDMSGSIHAHAHAHAHDQGGPLAPSLTYATPNSNTEDPGPHATISVPPQAQEEERDPIEPASSAIENPLSLRHAEFTTSSSGMTYYLGTSSNWSFTRRVLLLTHQHIHNAPLPPGSLIFDGAVYDVNWDAIRNSSDRSIHAAAVLPTSDHAMYLINTVKFNCSQLFHLFDEDDFMASFHQFYADPNQDVSSISTGLWYIHFSLIIALGKALLHRRQREKLPFGHEFFLSVVHHLPTSALFAKDPIVGLEVLCCAALYLQCIDHRHYAHVMIGDAVRLALFHGLHTDMPLHLLGSAYVERCRRVWWTIYILDREMTSLMGIPSSVHNDDIDCPLPTFAGSTQRVATLHMQVKLYQILTNINKRLYGKSGNLHCRYLARAKEVLENVADISDELRASFPLQPKEGLSGISRIAAHLHLIYHRCITIVTRPLLYYLLRLRFASSDEYLTSLDSMQTVRSLVRMCIDSSQQMITILDSLLHQGLLGVFFPYDMDAVFVATTNLLLGPAVEPLFSNSNTPWLHKAYAVFDEMINSGNLVAHSRKDELLQLDELLGLLSNDAYFQDPTGGTGAPQGLQASGQVPADGPDSRIDPSMEATMADGTTMNCADPNAFDPDALAAYDFDERFTREEILGLADAIDDQDMAWMCDTITGQGGVW